MDERAGCEKAEGQFGIADQRSVGEVASMLQGQEMDPVWKDWDKAILEPAFA